MTVVICARCPLYACCVRDGVGFGSRSCMSRRKGL